MFISFAIDNLFRYLKSIFAAIWTRRKDPTERAGRGTGRGISGIRIGLRASERICYSFNLPSKLFI